MNRVFDFSIEKQVRALLLDWIKKFNNEKAKICKTVFMKLFLKIYLYVYVF